MSGRTNASAIRGQGPGALSPEALWSLDQDVAAAIPKADPAGPERPAVARAKAENQPVVGTVNSQPPYSQPPYSPEQHRGSMSALILAGNSTIAGQENRYASLPNQHGHERVPPQESRLNSEDYLAGVDVGDAGQTLEADSSEVACDVNPEFEQLVSYAAYTSSRKVDSTSPASRDGVVKISEGIRLE